MNDPVQPRTQRLIDEATGQPVQLIYALPPELLGGGGDGSGADFSDLLDRLWRGRGLLIGLTMAVAVLAVAGSLLIPDRYTSVVTALPPQEKKAGALGQLSQLADLASMAGVGLGGTGGSSQEILAILDSRALRQRLVEEFVLAEYYSVDLLDDALLAFSEDFSVRHDKKTDRITFGYTHQDPQQAAKVAERATTVLQERFNVIHQSSSRRERVFLEQRLALASEELGKAQAGLAGFQRERGTIELESQIKATVEAIGTLQGQLIAQQIELRALLASQAGQENPQIQLLQQRVEELSRAIQKLSGSGTTSDQGVLLGLGSIPALGVEYLNKLRDLKRGEALAAMLIGQLEAARIAEVRDSDAIVIIDPAFVPQRKSAPKRALICIAATMLGGMIACLMVLLRPAWHRLRQRLSDPASAEMAAGSGTAA